MDTSKARAAGTPFGPVRRIEAGKFSGKYEHRTISGGVGHNLLQEAPQAFARAVIDAGNL
jgi:hypothetical protein